MEVGSEKLRYLVGFATAVPSTGEIKTVNLQDIYDLAKDMDEFTHVEY